MIKKGTFIEIEYTGSFSDKIFDTTSEKIAKENNIYNPNMKYGPITICIGEHQILKGLDEQLEKKDLGKYEIKIPPEKGFGKKNPKLMRLVSSSQFKKQKINPYPGLQINLDGIIGTIRTVTPGRVIIDFNHPLAGKKLNYNVEIKKIIENTKEKLDSLIQFYTKKFKTEIKEKEAIIKADLQEKAKDHLISTIKRLIPALKKITIVKE